MVVLKTIRHLSESVEEYFNITRQVHDIVRESGVKNGFVAVITAHTTTGIVVNEALPCVEADISEMLEKSVPLEAPYLHAHFLPTYGATSNNSQGHLEKRAHRKPLHVPGGGRRNRLRRRTGYLSCGIRWPAAEESVCRSNGGMTAPVW